MSVLIFVFLCLVIFGAKANVWGDKKWKEYNESKYMPYIYAFDYRFKDNYCDVDLENRLLREFPPLPKPDQARTELLSPALVKEIVSKWYYTLDTEEEFEACRAEMAQKHLAEIRLVERGFIPVKYAEDGVGRGYQRAILIWAGYKIRAAKCSSIHVVGRENGKSVVYTPGQGKCGADEVRLALVDNFNP